MIGRQLVNIVGLVVVVSIVVAGTLLIGLPMISQSFSTGAQAAQVDRTNLGTSAQVAALQSEKKDLAALTAQMTSLQKQIPSVNKQDDVFELVASAATATGVTVKSVKASAAVPWTARTTPEPATGDGSAAADSSAAPAPTPAPTSTPAPSASPAPGATTTTPAPSPQQQIPFDIVVDAPNAAAAAAFVDALGQGPRLVGIVHAALTNAQGTLELTVNALAFVRTPN
jgi:hypothetical protein